MKTTNATATAPASIATHTPTPFILREWDDARDGSHGFDIEAHPDFNANMPVAVCSGPDCAANAAFIVRACNSHARLVGVLHECADLLEQAKEHADKSGNLGMAAFYASGAEQARAALNAVQE